MIRRYRWLVVVMDFVDQHTQVILRHGLLAVFAMVNGAGGTVGFVIAHGVAHRNAAHEIANPACCRPHSRAGRGETVGEEEEAWRLTGVAPSSEAFLVDHSLGSEAFDPREWVASGKRT